jgi:hypothetical protein
LIITVHENPAPVRRQRLRSVRNIASIRYSAPRSTLDTSRELSPVNNCSTQSPRVPLPDWAAFELRGFSLRSSPSDRATCFCRFALECDQPAGARRFHARIGTHPAHPAGR